MGKYIYNDDLDDFLPPEDVAGKTQAFVLFGSVMAVFFVLGFLFLFGILTWESLETLGKIVGIPAMVFFLVILPGIMLFGNMKNHNVRVEDDE